jgi:hypothetical protein
MIGIRNISGKVKFAGTLREYVIANVLISFSKQSHYLIKDYGWIIKAHQ